jgi:hypothetical protein
MVLPSVADRASAMLYDAGDAARDTMTQIADKTATVAYRASHRLRDTIPDRDDRDTYLLGAAALAVTSAVGIACHRRAQEDTRPAGIEAAKVRSAKRQTESWKGSTLRLKRCIGSSAANREPCAMGGVGFSDTPPFKDTFHGQATEAP